MQKRVVCRYCYLHFFQLIDLPVSKSPADIILSRALLILQNKAIKVMCVAAIWQFLFSAYVCGLSVKKDEFSKTNAVLYTNTHMYEDRFILVVTTTPFKRQSHPRRFMSPSCALYISVTATPAIATRPRLNKLTVQ